MPIETDGEIGALLSDVRTIAVVGASDRPDRPSYGVMRALIDHGYTVVPINPLLAGKCIHGHTVLASLADLIQPVDLVDIFRNSEAAGPVIDEAISLGARAIWTQIGVVNEPAAARAEAAGLKVIMNRCPKIELARLAIPPIR